MVCVLWEEVIQIIVVVYVYIIKVYGFDCIVGFFVILVMLMVFYGVGFWFIELFGGIMLSFYDWYVDFFLVSFQVFGD